MPDARHKSTPGNEVVGQSGSVPSLELADVGAARHSWTERRESERAALVTIDFKSATGSATLAAKT
jgi:hypothetical protein